MAPTSTPTPKPTPKPMEKTKAKNEGEGNVTADRHYRQGVKGFLEKEKPAKRDQVDGVEEEVRQEAAGDAPPPADQNR